MGGDASVYGEAFVFGQSVVYAKYFLYNAHIFSNLISNIIIRPQITNRNKI